MGEVTFVTASDGVKLTEHVKGSGPPLYALHGGPMNDHRTFGDYLNPIAKYRALHLLDQRGCGDSDDAPADTYTLARLAENVEDTRAGLGHERIDLLGHSYGGLIALRFALRWPERVQMIIIAGTPARGGKGVVRSPGAWVVWGRQLLMNLKKNIDWNEYHLKHDVGNRERCEKYARTLRYRNVTIPRVQARS